jgi:hypothetical protein
MEEIPLEGFQSTIKASVEVNGKNHRLSTYQKKI